MLGVPQLAKASIHDIENGSKKYSPDFQENEDTVPLQRKLGSEIINETITSTRDLKKKEISWNNATYLDKVPLQEPRARSASLMLEHKASVGPCYRKSSPLGEPLGITVYLPTKSFKSLRDNTNPTKSGISITVSKRCFDSKSRLPNNNNYELKNSNARVNMKAKNVELKIEEDHYDNFCENLKGKFDNLCGKIRHVLHI